jgi:hypothetical protein
MSALYKLYVPHLIVALVFVLLPDLVNPTPARAGEPDEIIGPTDLLMWECIDRSEDAEGDFEIIDIEEVRQRIIDESVGNYSEDFQKLVNACEDEGDNVKLEPIARTKIEGYVYEFHPDPANPGEWFAVPSRDVPVIAEGVTFEIFWGSEPNGYFYFYKTRFGQGPVVLNLRLPRDAHPINPNILIESSGLDETWTVFLGFYRGDVAPEHPDQLKTPDGNFLPFGSSKYESIVGLDGKSALPGVGGILPQDISLPVLALAALLALGLPIAGVFTLYNRRGD